MCSESAKTQWSHLEMVENSNRDSEFSSRKLSDSLQTESINRIVSRRRSTGVWIGMHNNHVEIPRARMHAEKSARRPTQPLARSTA